MIQKIERLAFPLVMVPVIMKLTGIVKRIYYPIKIN